MKVLIAEDNSSTRLILKSMLKGWGYDVIEARDGLEALEKMKSDDAPQLVLLDWVMPGMDGAEVCRTLRRKFPDRNTYIILVTAKKEKENIVKGLEAGADDYVVKPFDRDELRARIRVGVRIINLQEKLAQRVRELEDALAHVKQLQGLLPICCYCKKIRNDKNYWEQVEHYISKHAEVRFTHGICPDCYEKYVRPRLEEWKRSQTVKIPEDL